MSSAFRQFVRSRPARYGFAVAVVALAVLLRVTLLQVVELKSPFLLLFAAIMLAAAFGGLGPGVVATLLASVASDIHMTGLPGHWRDIRLFDPAGLGIFFIEGLFLSLLGAMLYRAQRRAEASDAAARKLEQKILEISEAERRRIGHDLHDGLGQHLTGIALLSKALKQRLATMNIPESQQAAKIAALVNESIGWTRDLARGLSPVALESGGLAPALDELAENASNLLGIDCSFRGDSEEVPLDGEKSLHLYRIAQEAINNSVKHGKACKVQIELSSREGQIRLRVADDGVGLSDKTRAHPGLGLQIMEYRARMIGAALAISRRSAAGGTVVECQLAMPETQEVEIQHAR